jgi:ribosomal protein L39E
MFNNWEKATKIGKSLHIAVLMRINMEKEKSNAPLPVWLVIFKKKEEVLKHYYFLNNNFLQLCTILNNEGSVFESFFESFCIFHDFWQIQK